MTFVNTHTLIFSSKIFNTERFGQLLSYDIAVPPGSYNVTLYFAEIVSLLLLLASFG